MNVKIDRRIRFLQVLNLWRLLPAYLCLHVAPKHVKELVFDEMGYWRKCDQRKEKNRFDVFSGLMLQRKEYRSLLQYRMNRGEQGVNKTTISWRETPFYLYE